MTSLSLRARIRRDGYQLGHSGQRYFLVVCACGRRNKFHRWSWFTVGAARCRGCQDFILSPQGPMPLEVIHRSWFPDQWADLAYVDRVFAVNDAIVGWRSACVVDDDDWLEEA